MRSSRQLPGRPCVPPIRWRKEKLTIDRVTGLGRAIFAAVPLMIGGVLNIIYRCVRVDTEMVVAAASKVVMWRSDAIVRTNGCRGLGEARDLATLPRLASAMCSSCSSPVTRRPCRIGPVPDEAELRAWTLANLNGYWRGWVQRARHGGLNTRGAPPRRLAATGVLGAPKAALHNRHRGDHDQGSRRALRPRGFRATVARAD